MTGYFHHSDKLNRVKILLSAAYRESSVDSFAGFLPLTALASFQKNCRNATDVAKTRHAWTKNAKAVPTAVFASCLEMLDPKMEYTVSGAIVPFRLR